MISLFSKKTFKISLAVLSIVGYGVFVFAAGPFAPGTELDPACSPYINNDPLQGVDLDCTVTVGGGGGSLWSLAGGTGPDIYFDGGNVGVGTNSPTKKFEVNGDTLLSNGQSGFIIDDNWRGFPLNVGLITQESTSGAHSEIGTVGFGSNVAVYAGSSDVLSGAGNDIGFIIQPTRTFFTTTENNGDQITYSMSVGEGFIINRSQQFTQPKGLFTVETSADGIDGDYMKILTNGDVGIGINSLAMNGNGNRFQVGDGTTNIIGYVDDTTGNWVAVSDAQQKHNIIPLTYGLGTINQLNPVAFTYNRNNESTIGFLAQDVVSIIPEAVFGSEEKGYGMSYATLTPVLVKAIQELNLKLESIESKSQIVVTSSGFSLDGLRDWLGDVSNGIENIFARVIQADILKAKEQFCVGETCISETEFIQLLESRSITPDVPHESNDSPESENTDEITDEVVLPEDQTVTSSESSETEEIIPESSEPGSLSEITQ